MQPDAMEHPWTFLLLALHNQLSALGSTTFPVATVLLAFYAAVLFCKGRSPSNFIISLACLIFIAGCLLSVQWEKFLPLAQPLPAEAPQ